MQGQQESVTLEDELARALAPATDTDAGGETAPAAQSDTTLADATLAEAVGAGISWIPFAVYLAAWIALSAASAYLLRGATADQPARWLPEYVPLLWTGVGLTAAGPLLSLTAWLIARSRRPSSQRRGLLSSAMTRGALAAFSGVIIWVATLYIVEVTTMNGVL